MTDILLFRFDREAVRIVMVDGAPWWVASDVAQLLGYRDANVLARTLDDDEKGTHNLRTPGGTQRNTIISESGLFAAILKSRRSEARAFRRWVTGELLPTLRRSGRYEPPVAPATIAGIVIEDMTPAERIGLMREGRHVWNREEARLLWIRLGLPAPVADAAVDALAARVATATEGLAEVRMVDLVAALGMDASARSSAAIGAALRLLGWESRRARRAGRLCYVWTRPAREAA